MSWPALPDIDFGQSTAVDPSQFVSQVSHWDLVNILGHTPAVAIAAENTPPELKQMALPRFWCEGAADEIVIQAAHDYLEPNANRGARLVMLPGNYRLAGKVSLGQFLELDAHGAYVYYDGSYLGTMLEFNGSRTRLSGGQWNAGAANASARVIYVANDHCHIDGIEVQDGTGGPSLELASWNQTIIRSRVDDLTVAATAVECAVDLCQIRGDLSITAGAEKTRIGPANTIYGTVTDSGDGTRFPPGYQLDKASITSAVALTGAEADVTGLETATLNAAAGSPRNVRVRAHLLTSNTTAGASNRLNLKTTGGAYLDECDVYCAVAGHRYQVTLEWTGEITADTAWEVRGFEHAGSGQVDGSAFYESFIEVVDLGVMT